MQDPYLASVLKAIEESRLDADGPHLITVDELRAAGALEVPAAWRKSLAVERYLFSGLFDDDETATDEQQPAPLNSRHNVS